MRMRPVAALLLLAGISPALSGCMRIPFLHRHVPVPRVAAADTAAVAVRDVTDDSTTVLPDTVDARRPLGLPAKPRPRPARRPVAADTAESVPVSPVEGVMTAEDRQKATARVVADTTAAGQAMRKCAGKTLLPDQESVFDTVRSLLAQTGAALASGELWRAESLARKARQLAASLSCP